MEPKFVSLIKVALVYIETTALRKNNANGPKLDKIRKDITFFPGGLFNLGFK